MKFNKLYMALGVAALALASCSDDEEYTPAPAVVTPPAYFNISDEKEVELERTSTEFSIPIYRAEAGAALNPAVAVSIISGDGSSIGAFTALNDDNNPIFAEGATTGYLKYAVDMEQIIPMVEYSFLLKVEGESTPYFITSNEVVVSYVPWESMADPNTGALSTLVDNSLWQCLQGGLSMNLEVFVEKHPEKNFFRIATPYLNAVGAINAAIGGTFAEYYLDKDDPNYLYIDATNPDRVLFTDRKGDLFKQYELGIRGVYNENWLGYGNFLMIGGYWYYVNNEWYMVDDSRGLSPDNFEDCYGQFRDGKITFGEGVWFGFTVDKEAVWNGKEWTLKLGAGSSIGWSTLGESTFTDGIIAQYWGLPVPTYQVATMENTTKPGEFRLQNPYRAGVYPLGDSSTDVPGDGPWNVVIDCTDPNFVIIQPTATGMSAGTEQYIANAAGVYSTSTDVTVHMDKDQIIAAGLNDTYDPATRTITINHPMISGNGGSTWYKVWDDPNVPNFQPAVIVLPGEAQADTQAKRLANKATIAKARTSNKVTRR